MAEGTALTITDAQRRHRLAQRHRLLPGSRTNDLALLADELIGLHASDPATVYLSALVRMADPSIAAIEHALYAERSLIRHHAMRRTMWVMTPATARLAHAAATERIAANERKKNLKAIAGALGIAGTRGIDEAEAWLDAAVTEILVLLAKEGPLNTRQVGSALPHLVVPLGYGSGKHVSMLNAHTKILQGAGFDGLLVRAKPGGTWVSSEYPWAPTSSWLGEPLTGAGLRVSAAELAGRWLASFGPATETDVAWWFGWTKTLTRQALADAAAVEVLLESGDAAWLAPGDPVADNTDKAPEPEPWVRLLPGLDPTPMGWKERDWYLDRAYIQRVFDRNGNAGPTVWADGRIVGGWVQRGDGSIAVDLLESLSAEQHTLLDAAVDELRAAVGDVVVRPRFPSLNQRELLGQD